VVRRRSVRILVILALVMGLAAVNSALSRAQTVSPASTPAITKPLGGAPVDAARPAPAAEPPTAMPPTDAAVTSDTSFPEPTNLSVSTLITQADRIVQGVLALLGLASVLTWTILLAKAVELWGACRSIDRSLRLAESDAASTAATLPWPLLLMRQAVATELAASGATSFEGTKERLQTRLRRLEMRLTRRIQRGQGILATIGAVSPFIGLFGTVWGIMNSFVGIAKLHTTNLSVVAPGIAEALLATAAGLVAAIPAVVIYNVFVRWVGAFRHGLGDLSEIVLRHTGRRLDRDPALPGRARAIAAE